MSFSMWCKSNKNESQPQQHSNFEQVKNHSWSDTKPENNVAHFCHTKQQKTQELHKSFNKHKKTTQFWSQATKTKHKQLYKVNNLLKM